MREDVDDAIEIAVKSLLESGFYKWLTPLSDAVKLAFRLRTLGLGDNIDNLLYVTFMENDMLLLTMGEDLELLQNNYVDNLVDHLLTTSLTLAHAS
ncbi:MAG: hypothetical protein QXI32_04805 [Candidatus Bathyarchaeia archaeon]